MLQEMPAFALRWSVFAFFVNIFSFAFSLISKENTQTLNECVCACVCVCVPVCACVCVCVSVCLSGLPLKNIGQRRERMLI